MQVVAGSMLSKGMQSPILNTGGSVADSAQIIALLETQCFKQLDQHLKQMVAEKGRAAKAEISTTKLTSDLRNINGDYMRVFGYLGCRGLLGKDNVCCLRILPILLLE